MYQECIYVSCESEKMNQTFMKSIFLNLVIVCSLCWGCTAQTTPGTVAIGIVSGYSGTIVADEAQLESDWEDVLDNGGIGYEIDEMWIDTLHEGPIGQYGWYIFAKDAQDSNNSAVSLMLVGDTLFEMVVAGDGRTVTCTGCTDGCSPKRKPLNTGWRCTNCAVGGGECVKTETVTVNDVVFH